ncbi:MAG: hypothetical protein OHK0046_20730 [Anaerolineae bacterium]
MRYTEAQKTQALQEMIQADIATVSAKTGIPASTLRRWWSQHQTARAERLARSLEHLQTQLAEGAAQTAEVLQTQINGAPLNQLASALGVLVDRFLKINDLLSQAEGTQQERRVQIEYKYPDGSIHATPPWAAEDSASADALPGGGLWSPFWQNGSGQDRHYRNGDARRGDVVARADLPDGRAGLAGFEDDPAHLPGLDD